MRHRSLALLFSGSSSVLPVVVEAVFWGLLLKYKPSRIVSANEFVPQLSLVTKEMGLWTLGLSGWKERGYREGLALPLS